MAVETRRNIYLQGLLGATIASGYIFGPMIVIGGLGWWLAQRFDQVIIAVAGFLIALIVSNVLIFTRVGKDMARFQKKPEKTE